MLKKCENPLIEELTKSYKKRIFNLSDIRLPEGKYKVCVWCLGQLKGAQRRWCSEECIESAMAWGNPQKDYGLSILLVRQEFKCNICKFDYGTVVEALYQRFFKINGEPYILYGLKQSKDDWRTRPSHWIASHLKAHMHSNDLPHRLEVDHIVAISKGGQSLGLDNHQAICYTCHKTKTKVDLSGKKSKSKSE